MAHSIRIPRTLWYEADGGSRKTLSQSSLLGRREPMVILGEPGMGKTELLLWFKQQPGYAYCTARELNNARPPERVVGYAEVLVVDGLDEMSVRGDGDAVDVVLQKLGEAGYPRFVLACRVADWRSATAPTAIAEQYRDAQPLVLHLEPLTDAEIERVLVAELDGDVQRARSTIGHFDRLGLGGLLSNPQTLELAATVAKNGELPETKALLFDRAVELLAKEMNKAKLQLQLDKASAMDAAGAAFAALILTGCDALVIDSSEAADGEILAVEAAALPGASKLTAALGSRLFGTAGGPQRFRYWHRRIGEYLGARWLAQQANSAMQRRRILALFHGNGCVPSSLRGLHAWLAHHNLSLTHDVVAADVAAFIDYGEADSLSVTQAKQLLEALKELGKRNPGFYLDGTASAKSLVRVELLEETRAILKDSSSAFYLVYLLLSNIKGSTIAEPLRAELRAMMVSHKVDELLRNRAFEALFRLGGEDWLAILDDLRDRTADTHSNYLAVDIIMAVGVEALGADKVVEWVVTQSQDQERAFGPLHKLSGGISDACLETLLDELVLLVRTFEELEGPASGRPKMNGALADFAGNLIARRLNLDHVDESKLWRWLQAARLRYASDQTALNTTNQKLRDDTQLRRRVQKWVLLDVPGPLNPSERFFRMDLACKALRPDEDDLVALMGTMDPKQRTDERWRRLLQMIGHSPTEGAALRAAARPFAAHRPDLLRWIDRLGTMRFNRREIRNARVNLRREAMQQLKFQQIRAEYRLHLEDLRTGAFSLVWNAAVVFLGVAGFAPRKGAPQERLSTWLGQDLAAVAYEGFEAYLQSDGPPTVKQVGESNADSKWWEEGYVLLAAVLARFLDGRGFDGVSDDRLQAVFWTSRSAWDESIGKELRPALLEELRTRDLVDQAAACWIEPLLARRCSHVEDIRQVLWHWLSDTSAARLGLNWLTRFPDLPDEPESDILDRLLSLGLFDQVRPFVASRLQQPLTAERRDTWNAMAFLIDFDEHSQRLELLGEDAREVIWSVRRRQDSNRHSRVQLPLSLEQMAFFVRTFRVLYPYVPRPDGLTMGDRNPWDATRFIVSIANRLAQSTDSESIDALTALVNAPSDGYTASLLDLLAEQRRKLAEQHYRPISLDDLLAIANAEPPSTVLDLQSTVIELLAGVQKRISGDNIDSWRNFYSDIPSKTPHDEERCRDQVLLMLGHRTESIDFDPEVHSAADKRADIGATLRGMRLPIEIKGQWHSELWTAADTQLDRLYAIDHAADNRGIYLVLWFGNGVPKAKWPRARAGQPRPLTADALRRELITTSKAAREGRVAVVVLDLERKA